MYVSMSREYSGDGLFGKVLSLCSILNVISKQTKSFEVRFFISDFATFIRTERERERERECCAFFETTFTYVLGL